MKSLMFFLLSIVFIFKVTASEWVFQNNQGTYYLVSYTDERRHYLDEYYQARGEYQDRISHKVFQSPEDVNKFVNENYKNYSDKKVWNFLGMDKILTDIFSVDLLDSVESAGLVIWETKNTWNLEWEKRYAQWIEESVDRDFLKRNKVPVDCADVAYALRWIFARINHLPAANTLAGSGALFGNESFKSKWINLKKDTDWYNDKLFLTALNYLLDNTYTHTLLGDVYPIKISKESLIAGVIHLSLHEESGHTRIFSKTNYEDIDQIPLMFMSGTTPRMLRALYEEAFSIDKRVPSEFGGMVQMRWPLKVINKWRLMDAVNMPNYSLEQYESEYMRTETNFIVATFKRLGVEFKPDVIVKRQIEDIKEMVRTRIGIVEEGNRVCQIEDCAENTLNFENWSTPSRDKRILSNLENVKKFVQRFGSDNLRVLFQLSSKEYFVSIQGKNYNFDIIEFLWKYELYSSDPRDSINLRWGIDPDAVSVLAIRKINKAISERKLLIEKQHKNKKCTEQNQCKVGDPNWLDYNTYQIDKNFFEIAEVINKYAKVFSLEDYEELVIRLNKNFAGFNGQKIAFFNFIDLLPFLNSDPRVSVEQRWGNDRQKYYYFRFPSNMTSLLISAYAVALVDNQKIIDLYKGAEIQLPENMGPLFQNPDTGITVGVQKNEEEEYLIIYHPQTSSLEKIELNLSQSSEPYEIIWHSTSVFSLYRYPELRVFKLDLKFSSSTTLLNQFYNISKMTSVANIPADKKHQAAIMFNLSNDLDHKYLLKEDFDDISIQKLSVELDRFDKFFVLGAFKQFIVLSKKTSTSDGQSCSVFINDQTGAIWSPFENTICVQKVWNDLNMVAIKEWTEHGNKWDLSILNNDLEIMESQSLGYSAVFYENEDDIYIHSVGYDSQWRSHSFKYSKSRLEEFNFPDKTIVDGQGLLLHLYSEDGSSSVYNMFRDEMINIPISKILVYFPRIPKWSYYYALEDGYFHGASFDYLGFEIANLNDELARYKNAIVKFDSLSQNQFELFPIMTTPTMWDSNNSAGLPGLNLSMRNGYLQKMTIQGDWFWFTDKPNL